MADSKKPTDEAKQNTITLVCAEYKDGALVPTSKVELTAEQMIKLTDDAVEAVESARAATLYLASVAEAIINSGEQQVPRITDYERDLLVGWRDKCGVAHVAIQAALGAVLRVRAATVAN